MSDFESDANAEDSEPAAPAPEADASRRLLELKTLVVRLKADIQVGALTWNKTSPDLRALTINSCIRRQQDALEGAVALGDAGQGQLAVAFVRSFLEERMWIAFLADMERGDADALLLAMGNWDSIRALTAQRDYIGDADMTVDLWYPPGFVDALAARLPATKSDLHRIRAKWGWSGTLPSSGWIADQVSLREEYDYLHSATSRAVHFSAGEVMRRGWGTPGGVLVTDKAEFRAHVAEFAYDQLWRQHLETLVVAADRLDEAAVVVAEEFWAAESRSRLLASLQALGRVPLVHAHEWNLTPPPFGTRFAWAAVMHRQADSADGQAVGEA